MADKKKKSVKVRDLKPSKDAKGGAAKLSASHLSSSNLSSSNASSSRFNSPSSK